MFGASLASQLRRMSDDDFPILVLANGKATQNEATEIVKGKKIGIVLKNIFLRILIFQKNFQEIIAWMRR